MTATVLLYVGNEHGSVRLLFTQVIANESSYNPSSFKIVLNKQPVNTFLALLFRSWLWKSENKGNAALRGDNISAAAT